MSDNLLQGAAIFLIGVGVGAAAGVLFAPKSGEETRDQITGAVNDGVNTAINQGKNLGRRAQKTIENTKVQVRDAAEAGEQAFRNAKTAGA